METQGEGGHLQGMPEAAQKLGRRHGTDSLPKLSKGTDLGLLASRTVSQ